MWRDYSAGYIKNNRANSISIAVAALIASLCLSFLCTMAYNLWIYEVEKIKIEEGDWQGRITGEIDDDALRMIRNFGNVERAVVNQELSNERETVVDVYFQKVRTIFEDMPLLIEQLGIEEEGASYHVLLLSRYLIHDPRDSDPPLLLSFYLVILCMFCLSLVLVIRNSFAVSIHERVRQFGIFSSIGATPAQIRACLVQEAAALCISPVLLGIALGVALSFGADQGMNAMMVNSPERHVIGFQYHPAIFFITLLSSGATVLFSAWLPARKLSKLTPLEAIRNGRGLELKKKKRSPILAALFGLEGEIAGNALKAQRKSIRTSTISLTLAFGGFTMMLCLFALTDLSSKYTYVERYKDRWDVMVTIKDTKMEDFTLTEEMQGLEGVRDCIVYQKADAKSAVSERWISEELTALGGPKAVAGSVVSDPVKLGEEDAWFVNAPVMILDDVGFDAYCEQIGIASGQEGTIVLNEFWDSLNSNFRYRRNIPYVREDRETIVLQNKKRDKFAEIPVLAYTREVPVLKEEYDNYALVQFLPLSLWKKMGGQIEDRHNDINIRFLAEEGAALEDLNQMEEEIAKLVGTMYEMQSKNRIEDYRTNEDIIRGYKRVVGSFCGLLAVIGFANVFSYTMGFLHQRKRELAQYMSVGMTHEGIRKMFCIEALVIAGRPVLITLPLTAGFVVFTTKKSYLKMAEVLPEMPYATIALFSLMVLGIVGLAYYIGGRRIVRCNLCEMLRDDTSS